MRFKYLSLLALLLLCSACSKNNSNPVATDNTNVNPPRYNAIGVSFTAPFIAKVAEYVTRSGKKDSVLQTDTSSFGGIDFPTNPVTYLDSKGDTARFIFVATNPQSQFPFYSDTTWFRVKLDTAKRTLSLWYTHSAVGLDSQKTIVNTASANATIADVPYIDLGDTTYTVFQAGIDAANAAKTYSWNSLTLTTLPDITDTRILNVIGIDKGIHVAGASLHITLMKE